MIIATPHGDRWEVLELAEDGHPLDVTAAEPWARGTYIEARLNFALKMHQFKRALHRSLPAWLRRLVPEPRRFWSVVA